MHHFELSMKLCSILSCLYYVCVTPSEEL